jgi:hypothetical protein
MIARALRRTGCTILSAMGLLGMSRCDADGEALRRALLDAMDRAASDPRIEAIDVQSLTGIPVEKVCIQPPYLPQTEFEKQAGRKVQRYEEQDDRGQTIWIFLHGREPVQLKINRWLIAERRNAPLCSLRDHALHVERSTERSKYYLKGD